MPTKTTQTPTVNLRIYIDNSILSRSVDGKLKKSDQATLNKFLKSTIVTFVYSLKTKEEIEATINNETRIRINKTLQSLNNVELATWTSLSYTSGYSSQDTERTELRKNFYDTSRPNARAEPTNDGDHVYAAFKSNCDYFLTHDKKLFETSVKKKETLKALIGSLQIINLRALREILG